MRPLLSFCQTAQQRITAIAAMSAHNRALVSVKGGGCGGLKYSIEPMDDAPSKHDEEIKIGETTVVLCGHSLFHLIGTHISWSNDLMGSRFVFDNPNAGSTCGCGNTFSPKG